MALGQYNPYTQRNLANALGYESAVQNQFQGGAQGGQQTPLPTSSLQYMNNPNLALTSSAVLGGGIGSYDLNKHMGENGVIFQLVIDLMEPSTRETALLELSKKREQYDELALVLWHSFGMHQSFGL
jgi:hypothetical protein